MAEEDINEAETTKEAALCVCLCVCVALLFGQSWHAALSGFAAGACACPGTTCRMLNTILFQTRAGYVWADWHWQWQWMWEWVGSAAFH